MVLNFMGKVAQAILHEPIENASRRIRLLSLWTYQVIGEKKNRSQPQSKASGFGNVKVELMILELNDSTNEDVHEVLNLVVL
jgi:hypothetical protein